MKLFEWWKHQNNGYIENVYDHHNQFKNNHAIVGMVDYSLDMGLFHMLIMN